MSMEDQVPPTANPPPRGRFLGVMDTDQENRFIKAIAIASVLLVVTLLGFAYSNLAKYKAENEAIRRSHRIIHATDRFFALVNDAESSSRGFLLTGDSTYLQQYSEALPALDSDLAELLTLLPDTDGVSRPLGIKVTMRQKLSNMQSLIKDQQRGRSPLGQPDQELMQAGRRQMEELKRIHTEIIGRHGAALEHRSEQQRSLGLVTPMMILLYALLALLGVGLLFFRLIRTLERVQQAEKIARNTARERDKEARTSAAAVAAMLAAGATATDTGGSIRQPAALCGITGLKPTYGRVSRWGMIAFASSLDQGGVMARSAQDAAILLNAMASYDAKDSTCVNEPVPNYLSTLHNKLEGLRIGIPDEYFGEGLHPGTREAVEEAIRSLEKLGARMQSISLPHSALSVPAYYVIAPAECSANLSRFDGVRYGHRCDDPKDLMDLFKRSRGEGFGEEVKRRILVGTYALSAGYYDAYYRKAQQVRRLIKNDFVEAFKQVDVILGPTSPSPAFEFGAKGDDPVAKVGS